MCECVCARVGGGKEGGRRTNQYPELSGGTGETARGSEVLGDVFNCHTCHHHCLLQLEIREMDIYDAVMCASVAILLVFFSQVMYTTGVFQSSTTHCTTL